MKNLATAIFNGKKYDSISIIETEDEMLGVLHDLFFAMGYKAEIIPIKQGWLEKLQETQNTIVIIDQNSRNGGFESFCKKIKKIKQGSGVKLCALLDSGKIEDIENCYEAGADLCILKPFNIKSFINKLHNLSNRKTQMPEFDDTFNQFESDDLLRCKALISAILKN